MWILYSLLALLGLLAIVLSVPVYGQITYMDELCTQVRFLGITVPLWPRVESPPKKKVASSGGKRKTVKKEEPSKLKELSSLLKQDNVEGTLRFLCQVASLASKTIGRLLRAITIRRFDLALMIASEDPADTAKRYGQVCGVLYPALSAIEQVVGIQERNVRVEPNFLMEKSAVRFEIDLRMSLWRLLGAGIALLWGFLMLKEQSHPQNK